MAPWSYAHLTRSSRCLWYGTDRPMPKKLKLQDKAYRQQENKRMAIEDMESSLRTVVERAKAELHKEADLHAAELEHQVESMETVFLKSLQEAEAKTRIVKVEVERIVEVYVDPRERPQPMYIAGQSVFQWWANWMAGAASSPSGVAGKKGRPQWYSSSVFAWEQFCFQACRDAGVPGAPPGTNLPRETPSIPVNRPAC